MFVSRKPRWSEDDLRVAVEASVSLSETLRRMGLRTAGGNFATVRRWISALDISTTHFDQTAASRGPRPALPLSALLVAESTYNNRGRLKRRLYDAGLKQRACELCGQGEI